MTVDLQQYKVAKGDQNASATINDLVDALEAALNNIGGGGPGDADFGSGLIFDLAQFTQNTAAVGDWPQWNGSAWAKATPPTVTGATVIKDTTLLSPATTVDFSSISAGYRHLMLIGYLRSDRAATLDHLGIRLNNDTGANYDGYSASIAGTGTPPSESAGEHPGETSVKFENAVVGDTATAGMFTTVRLYVPHYAGTSNNKILRSKSTHNHGTALTAPNDQIVLGVGAWRSNNAVNRLTLLPVGGGANFKAGSRVVLYGM